MRISTQTLYDRGVAAMQDQQYKLLRLQEQIASGRRVLTPSDDPVSSARALEVSQSLSTTEQFLTNQRTVVSTLGEEEANLAGVESALLRVRELAVQAGNATLDDPQRAYIAEEMSAMLEEIIGQANATDGNGNFLFSGFQGSTQPFVRQGDGSIAYQGDDGQRLAQVSPTRRLPISDSGADAFMRIPNGNGYFSATMDPDPIASANTGTGVISAGTVTHPDQWRDPENGKDYQIVFARDETSTPPVTTYDIVSNVSTVVNGVTYNPGDSLISGGPATVTAGPDGGPRLPRVYDHEEGQSIAFRFEAGDANPDNAWNLGINVDVTGEPRGNPPIGPLAWPPAAGSVDEFRVQASRNESVFESIRNIVDVLATPIANGDPLIASANRAKVANAVAEALTNLSNDLDRVSTVRAAVGSRLNEATELTNVNQDLILQYNKTLSNLQDLDYAEAVSQLSQQQVSLEASQKAYMRVTGLSLFNFLN